MKQQGLLRRRPLRYTITLIWWVTLMVGGIALLPLVAQNLALLLMDTLLIAVAFVQLAFTGHEVSHHAIFRSPRANDVLALFIFNVLLGANRLWWVATHNREHHGRLNRLHQDPNIFPSAQWLEDGGAPLNGLCRWLLRHQRIFLFPMLALTGLQIRVESIVFLCLRRPQGMLLEVPLMAVGLALHFGLPFLLLPPGTATLYVALGHLMAGFYMGLVVTSNHTGLPMLPQDTKLDFFTQAVFTTRDIVAPRWLDFLYVALNYQVVHHLFPAMTRYDLPRGRELVRQYCLEHGLPYHACSLWQCYREILDYLSGPRVSERLSRDLG